MRAILLAIIFLVVSSGSVLAASIVTSSDKTNLGVDEELSVSTTFSISQPDGTQYYLRGVFYKSGTFDYCGYVWNGSGWFSEGWINFLPVTIQNGSWSGTLKAKVDPSDSGCKESGSYLFKIQRFTSSGNSALSSDDQNEITLNVSIPTPTPTPQPTFTPTPNPTKTPTPSPTVKPSNTPTPTPTKIPTPTVKLGTSPTVFPTPIKKIGKSTVSSSKNTRGNSPEGVLGEATSSDDGAKEAEVLSARDSVFPWWVLFFVAGGGILLVSCGILLFRKYKERKEHLTFDN